MDVFVLCVMVGGILCVVDVFVIDWIGFEFLIDFVDVVFWYFFIGLCVMVYLFDVG